MSRENTKDLAVVMPVYNEEECIQNVVHSWIDMLAGLECNFVIIVVNDGSTDTTGERLSVFLEDACVWVIDKENEGHGPSVLCGYHVAAGMAEWVFQIDSDNELLPAAFPPFWHARCSGDLIAGVRKGRRQSLGRAAISLMSRLVVRVCAGQGVRDVNVPYRLIRTRCLARLLPLIPAGTFAPNVAISGLATASRLRIINLPVAHQPRSTGIPSLVHWNLWWSAVRSLVQTICILKRRKP